MQMQRKTASLQALLHRKMLGRTSKSLPAKDVDSAVSLAGLKFVATFGGARALSCISVVFTNFPLQRVN